MRSAAAETVLFMVVVRILIDRVISRVLSDRTFLKVSVIGFFIRVLLRVFVSSVGSSVFFFQYVKQKVICKLIHFHFISKCLMKNDSCVVESSASRREKKLEYWK